MSARRERAEPCTSAITARARSSTGEQKIRRDEEKSKEQLIEELLELRQKVAELEEARDRGLASIQGEINFGTRIPSRIAHEKGLSGLLSICTSCKKIREDSGRWTQLELYICEHSDAEFSHGLCPECVRHYYPVDILARTNAVGRKPDGE